MTAKRDLGLRLADVGHQVVAGSVRAQIKLRR